MGNSDSRTDFLHPDAASVDDRRDASPDAGSRLRLVNGGCDCSLGRVAAARPAPPFALLSAALLLRRLRRKRGE
jgi:MYXO-CTERM domain-containing protein